MEKAMQINPVPKEDEPDKLHGGDDSEVKLSKVDENAAKEEFSDSDEEDNDPNSELNKERQRYYFDVKKSGEFAVGMYPLMDAAGVIGMIRNYYDPPAMIPGDKELSSLVRLAQLAVYCYNMKKGTNYDNVKVLRTTTLAVSGIIYNITFEASLSMDNSVVETFQTKIYKTIPWNTQRIEIYFVRVKPSLDPLRTTS